MSSYFLVGKKKAQTKFNNALEIDLNYDIDQTCVMLMTQTHVIMTKTIWINSNWLSYMLVYVIMGWTQRAEVDP